MAADIDLKIQILKKSMSTFSGWLDQCEELINALPTQLEMYDHAHLRELAMKYKDLLLQMKERCDYMNEVNALCKEIGDTTAPQSDTPTPSPLTSDEQPDDKGGTSSPPSPSTPSLNPRLAELATEVKDLNTRFSTTCIQARQHYSSLSKAMAVANASVAGARDTVSLHSFSFSLSSPTAERKGMRRGSGSFDVDEGLAGDGAVRRRHKHASKHHKKSKGGKGKKRDRFSLSLDPDEEEKPHPLSRAKKVQSAHYHNLTISTSAPPSNSAQPSTGPVRGETDKNLPRRAVVTDLDGFAWGGDLATASVDSTSPAATVSNTSGNSAEHRIAASSNNTTKAESESGAVLDDTTRQSANAKTVASSSTSGVVLRRGQSVPEDTAHAQKRDSTGGLRFVRELGLVQVIREEGARGLRPRSAVLLSDSEQDLTGAVKSAIFSPGSGQAALLNKAIRRRSADFGGGERRRLSSSSITLHTLSEMDAVESFEDSSSIDLNSPFLASVKSGSLSDLPTRSRLSFVSVDTLDPRPIPLGGANLRQELSRIASSERASSIEPFSDRSLENDASGLAFKNHHPISLLSPGRLDPRKSRSMDVLSPTGPPPKVTLSVKLGELTNQLQEFVHAIAESKHCALQSLALELRLGEVKAMLSILEVQDLELLRLRALYSSDDLRRLELREKERRERLSPSWKDHSASYPVEEVKKKKEDIEKLTQRIALLKNHCEESIQQTEEVLEFVTQFETELKMLRQFISSHTHRVELVKKKNETFSEETWTQLQQALTEINEHKDKLQSVQELSSHLLFLEPIFDGMAVRDDLQTLANQFQNLVMEVFSILETQAKNRTDQLLLELSVLRSWVTETELAVQALAKKTRKVSSVASKVITMKETLDHDLQKKKESLLAITEKIHPITAVLNPDDSSALRDLIFQVDSHTKSLMQLENSLQVISLDLRDHDLAKGKSDGKFQDSQLSQTDSSRCKENSGRFQGSGRMQKNSAGSDDSDDGNYADIDALRKQILQPGSKVPAPSVVIQRQTAGQASSDGGRSDASAMNASGRHRPVPSPSGSAAPPGLYERVEEMLPSPFADYDLVPSRSLDTAIEQLPRQLGPKVTLSQPHPLPVGQAIYDVPPSSSLYQSPRSSPFHSPSHSVTTPTSSSYYQVPSAVLRQAHHHSASTPSPSPVSLQPPSSLAQEATSPSLEPTKGRYVEIDVGSREKKSSSLAIKKSSSAGSIGRLQDTKRNRERHMEGGEEEIDGERKQGRRRRRRKRRSERASLHEELLEFISREWAALDMAEIATQSSQEEEIRLDEAVSCLESYDLRSSCVKFVNGLRDLESRIVEAKEQVSLIRTPRVPDLEQVHSYIDQCQKLGDRISHLHPRLEAFNEESLSLVSSLGRAPTCAKVAQLLEIKLFDVSTLWHSSNMKVATCMRELREREGEINTLYRQLQTISRALDEARGLLDKKLTVLDVQDYLGQCKAAQTKLGSLAEVRVQVTTNIKSSVLHSPQLPVCQSLLDQLKQVDAQWINIIKELSDVSQLEPILIKKMFVNISKEIVATETKIKELTKERTLKLAESKNSCKLCQDFVQKLKTFKSTLTSTDARLVTIIETASQTSHDSSGSDDGMELSGVRRSGSNVSKRSSSSASDSVTGIQVEMVITQYGPELASINHKELLKLCKLLLQRDEELLSRTETLAADLQNESDLLGKFYSELEDLQLWVSDTKSMLGSGSHSNGVVKSNAASTSVAQLRGKHQAICQQVAARQSKMETVQNLASEVLKLPSNQSDLEGVKKQLTQLYNDWDDICQQCVPAGALPKIATPTGPGGGLAQFLSSVDFEDEAQMIEWLILVESRLQHQPITVGDFRQLRRQQREMQTIESELKSREKDYVRFMKGFRASTLSISQTSDILDPESSVTRLVSQISQTSMTNGSKSVKFFDENTLERFKRQQDIGNGINFSDSGSKSPESDMANSLQGAVKEEGAVGGATSSKPHPLVANGDRYHYMGPESAAGGLHHHSSAPAIGLAAAGPSQTSMGTPGSPVPDDVYQLAILWRGIWTTLGLQKKRLDSVQDAWKAFETKKEEFVNFLAKAEERCLSVFKVLGSTKDLAIMNAEFGAYASFAKEVQTHGQNLTKLNEMSHDLITNHHSNDDTQDLQDAMNDLNVRWKKVMQSFTEHQPTVSSLHTRWLDFFRDYQSFLQWLRTMDLDMSNLNPFVKDMDAVKTQLEKLKEIQQELHVKEGVVESIRLHAHQLLQGVGGSHINAAAIHGRLDNMGRRWDHLQTLAKDRKTALEQALTEKQDFLSRLADVLAWLNQAEKHLASQKPLGSDYYTVHNQYQAQQGFWLEMTEQRSKVEAVITSGRQVAMETHWPQGTGESLRSQYGGLEERWRKMWSEGEQWGQLLQSVHPELEKFQTLCSECGQKLSDAELKMVKQEPVAKKMAVLKQQYEALQQFENVLLGIGDILESLVLSQKTQLQLGVKVSSDLIQLVKRFHQRWNDLKQKVEGRHSAIDKALVKYDPVNLGVAELPFGWQRSTTDNGTPYYINTSLLNTAQWHHPELSELYNRLKSEYNLPSYPSTAYPIALKLRAIQKRIQLNLLKTDHAMSIFTDHSSKTHRDGNLDHPLSPYEATCLAIDMFQKVEEMDSQSAASSQSVGLYMNSAVELSTCFLRDVFDVSHHGSVTCLSFHIGIICMSNGKLDDKYKALFNVIANGQSGIDMEQLTHFLEQVVQIPQSVCETQFCSLHAVDVCVRDCYKKYVGVGRLQLPQFVSWLQTEPPPLSWLPILHRLAASEKAHHPVKCSLCKAYPITGFRYRCVQCTGFDMCQNCYWSGKSGKGHDRSKHFMEEFCVPPKTNDNVFRTLQRSFRQKKNKSSQPNKKQPTQQTAPAAPPRSTNPSAPAAKVGGDNQLAPPTIRKAAGSTQPSNGRHSAYVALTIGEIPRPPPASSTVDDEAHPGRRFTVAEDMRTAWQRGGAGGGAKATPKDTSPQPPPIPPRIASSKGGMVATQSANTLPIKGKKYVLSYPPESRTRNRGNMDASLSQLTEKNKKLSRRLSSLREHRSSISNGDRSKRGGTQTTPSVSEEQPDGGVASQQPAVASGNATEKLSVEEQLRRRNAYLQGRVDTLQVQNVKLGRCISELKNFTDLQRQQQYASVAPRSFSPNPYLLPLQNGGPSSSAPVHQHQQAYNHPNYPLYASPSSLASQYQSNPLNGTAHHLHPPHPSHPAANGVLYSRTSPIPPPSKYIQPPSSSNRPNSQTYAYQHTGKSVLGGRVSPVPNGRVSPVPNGRVSPVPPGRVSPTPHGRVSPVPPGRVSPIPPGRVSPTPHGRVSPVPPGRVSPIPAGRISPGPHGRISPVPPGRVSPNPNRTSSGGPSAYFGASGALQTRHQTQL